MRSGLMGMGFVGISMLIGWGAATGHGWIAIGALLVLAFAVGRSIQGSW